MTPEQVYEIIHEEFETIQRSIIQSLSNREGKDQVSTALFCLLVRETNTWRSIRLLHQHTPKEFRSTFMVDVGTLLRAMFDASLQAEFIFCVPATRVERATQYLDFEHVERYKMARIVLRHDNPLAQGLQSSPYKAEEEVRLQQEFDRVKDSFLVVEKQRDASNNRGQRTRNKWYDGDLSRLATAVGRAAEYDTFVGTFSGCVHSSVFAVRCGPCVPEDHVMQLSTTLAARVARMNVEYNQLNIGEKQMILDELCKSWLDPD